MDRQLGLQLDSDRIVLFFAFFQALAAAVFRAQQVEKARQSLERWSGLEVTV